MFFLTFNSDEIFMDIECNVLEFLLSLSVYVCDCGLLPFHSDTVVDHRRLIISWVCSFMGPYIMVLYS